jgi:hypothetical protein
MNARILSLPAARLFACLTFAFAFAAHAQISTVVFQDDFSANTIDPARYQPDAPFFEGGSGDIHAEARNGTIEFVGTTSVQWWSGGTLRVAQAFTATEQNQAAISIDRVREAGVGSASRSALWILDETKTKYVLFADVRGEGGWRYNRKIGETGDVPTGQGTDIVAFNGGTFDNGGLHRMKMVADGKTVKLYLDNQLGVEVKFPFSKVIFEFGSYARAVNDTASTTWDNLQIEAIRQTKVLLEDDFSSDTINTTKFEPDAPFFEGGVGDIHAEARNGTIEFVGKTTVQWWSGATLKAVPVFSATDQTVVMASIDRVREAGVGSASRSALWILDESRTKYVLFADVRGEGGWRFNRKIGETGDVPTGQGTDITAFNGGTFDNGGLHKMAMIADGKTVKLMLDGQVGAEVKFPFSRVIFEFGSYARAVNDTASTTWDNFKVQSTVRQTTVVFQDDFASNSIDPAKYQPDAPFFEGGVGDIHAEARNGTIEFVGTTTQRWWSGGTLRVVPTFEASESSILTVSIDRVREAGVGSASRSALWILDETKTKYVLFADVRAEGGWRYNRKIGETGDVPTGSGNDIAAFNGGTFDNGALHRMTMIADGRTVKLLLDGIQGVEVKFPFSPVIIEFGSYARDNLDTAATTWDNLVIETAGGATFAPGLMSVRAGQNSGDIIVKIPAGLNSQSAVQVRVVSSNPAIAEPLGATAGVLTLNFAAGAPNTQTIKVRGVALGTTLFSLEGDAPGGNQLAVAVISGPGVQLQEAFTAATIDPAKWQISNAAFEAGTGQYTVGTVNGVLEISGTAETDFWSGASLRTANSFVALRDLNLSVDVERVALEANGSGGRSSVRLTNADRTRSVLFAQNTENNWQVNVNPGNPTGGGTVLTALAGVTDNGAHRMKLIANGQTVEVLLDGVSAGRFPFEVSSGIFVELGGYARATGDSIVARFDDVKIDYLLPCTSFSPLNLSMTIAETGRPVTVTIPTLMHDIAPLALTVTSRNPTVAIPVGGVAGALTLNFAAGASDSQSFTVAGVAKGTTTFDLVSVPANCVVGSLQVEVVAVPVVLLTDDFATQIDPIKWTADATPFDSGAATAESAITIANGQVKMDVTAESPLWPGLALFTSQTYTAALTAPLTFEIDRALLEFVLTTGTGSEQRTGIWVKEAAGNFVFFNEYVAHDGRNFGWGFNKVNGGPDDDPTGSGVNIDAFDAAVFNDQKQHRMKMVMNGVSAKLYLDDVFGAEVPFAFSRGLTLGFGTYVDETGNVARGYFDNARITGGEGAAPLRLNSVIQGSNFVISWTGSGTLETSETLATGSWAAVSPAPTGSLSIPLTQLSAKRFYRLRQ